MTRTSTAVTSGSGNVTVNALDVLDAETCGSGNAIYTGDPQVTQRISGSGELHRTE
jgi:hypothetical protein